MTPSLYAREERLLLTDQTLLTKTPYTHGLPASRWSTTKVGPRPQSLFPSSVSLWVGICIAGPAPQIQPCEVRGEKNALNRTSPIPLVRLPYSDNGGSLITGRIVRVMTFQSGLMAIGMTG